MNYSILRGRFQPFSRPHYDSIRGFYEEYAKALDDSEWPWLVVCIVRDHETLLGQHQLLKRHIAGPYLRHLSFFNPLSIAFCEYYIREGIQYFYGQDRQTDTQELGRFQRFLAERMIIQAVPLKLMHVLNSLKRKGQFRVEEIMDLLGNRRKKPSNDIKMLLQLLPIIAFETLAFPGSESLAWFLPVLDREDIRDNEEIRKHDYEVRLKYHRDVAVYHDDGKREVFFRPELKPFDDISFISHYGVFIYFSYLHFARKTTVLNHDQIKTEMKRVEEFIDDLVTPTCFTDYITRIEEITQSLNTENLPNEERKILEDPSEFVTQSLLYLRVPDPVEYSRLKAEGSELGVSAQNLPLTDVFSSSELALGIEKAKSWQALPGDFGTLARELMELLTQASIQLEKQPQKKIPFLLKDLWRATLAALRQNQPDKVSKEFIKQLRSVL